MRRLLLLLVLVWLVPCARGDAASWAPPVRGAPVRLFDLGRDPFVRGRHRGVILAAAPGEPVRAACGGVVRFAGRVAGTGTVSKTCGRWRVSYAPLKRLAVWRRDGGGGGTPASATAGVWGSWRGARAELPPSGERPSRARPPRRTRACTSASASRAG